MASLSWRHKTLTQRGCSNSGAGSGRIAPPSADRRPGSRSPSWAFLNRLASSVYAVTAVTCMLQASAIKACLQAPSRRVSLSFGRRHPRGVLRRRTCLMRDGYAHGRRPTRELGPGPTEAAHEQRATRHTAFEAAGGLGCGLLRQTNEVLRLFVSLRPDSRRRPTRAAALHTLAMLCLC
jgi:hypothetical protein